jgi:hypothetical protein
MKARNTDQNASKSCVTFAYDVFLFVCWVNPRTTPAGRYSYVSFLVVEINGMSLARKSFAIRPSKPPCYSCATTVTGNACYIHRPASFVSFQLSLLLPLQPTARCQRQADADCISVPLSTAKAPVTRLLSVWLIASL